jgi:hypothetical protein
VNTVAPAVLGRGLVTFSRVLYLRRKCGMEPPSPLAPPLQGALGKILPSRFAGASQAMRNPRYTPEGEGETCTLLYLRRKFEMEPPSPLTPPPEGEGDEIPFVTTSCPFGERPFFE